MLNNVLQGFVLDACRALHDDLMGSTWHLPVPHLDVSRALYALYDVKYINLVSLR